MKEESEPIQPVSPIRHIDDVYVQHWWVRKCFEYAAQAAREVAGDMTHESLNIRQRVRRLAALFDAVAKEGGDTLFSGGTYRYVYHKDEKGRLVSITSEPREGQKWK